MSGNLGGSERSRVHRVDGYVVKTYLGPGEGRVREAAALDVLGRLVAETDDSLTMTDLGTGPSLADLLLGRDAGAAADGVAAWAHRLAMLQCECLPRRSEFEAALTRRSSQLPVAAEVMPSRVIQDAAALDALGLVEARAPVAAVGGPTALTPGDACPDNNVVGVEGLHMLDFEDAQWRAVAWDVAYLTVPWPSCWCSWLLPHAVSQRAVDTYRDAVADTMPAVASDAFEAELATATAGWALVSAAWFLPRALADDPPLDPRAPTRRAMITHRLSQAVDHPQLGGYCGLLLAELLRRWGEGDSLDLAPAFR